VKKSQYYLVLYKTTLPGRNNSHQILAAEELNLKYRSITLENLVRNAVHDHSFSLPQLL